MAVPEETWRLAVRRAEVIARLAAMGTVGLDGADAAAAEGSRDGWCMCCWVAGGRGKVWCRT